MTVAPIRRIDTGERMSQAAIHGGVVYLAGQCGTAHAPVETQTREALDRVDRYLEAAGSDRSRLLAVTIWLSSIEGYDAMNAVWDAWIPPGAAPARACSEARLGGEGYRVEIICTAARR